MMKTTTSGWFLALFWAGLAVGTFYFGMAVAALVSTPESDGPHTQRFLVRDRQVIHNFGEVIILKDKNTDRTYLLSDRGGVIELKGD